MPVDVPHSSAPQLPPGRRSYIKKVKLCEKLDLSSAFSKKLKVLWGRRSWKYWRNLHFLWEREHTATYAQFAFRTTYFV